MANKMIYIFIGLILIGMLPPATTFCWSFKFDDAFNGWGWLKRNLHCEENAPSPPVVIHQHMAPPPSAEVKGNSRIKDVGNSGIKDVGNSGIKDVERNNGIEKVGANNNNINYFALFALFFVALCALAAFVCLCAKAMKMFRQCFARNGRRGPCSHSHSNCGMSHHHHYACNGCHCPNASPCGHAMEMSSHVTAPAGLSGKLNPTAPSCDGDEGRKFDADIEANKPSLMNVD